MNARQFASRHRMLAGVVAGLTAGVTLGGTGLALARPSHPHTHASSGYRLARHVRVKEVAVATDTSKSVDVKCKSGFVAISGGGHVGSNNNFPPYASPDAFVSESSLDQSGRGWRTTFTVASPQGATEFTAMVVCVHPR